MFRLKCANFQLISKFNSKSGSKEKVPVKKLIKKNNILKKS